MSKKVLVLCTGNSCRSIIAEALINHSFNGQIEAHSSGVSSSGRVNPKAKKILVENEMWKSSYHSKGIDSIIHIPFDLVITVCENASQTCPIFLEIYLSNILDLMILMVKDMNLLSFVLIELKKIYCHLFKLIFLAIQHQVKYSKIFNPIQIKCISLSLWLKFFFVSYNH